jgi:hypothetical protein
MRLVAPYSPDVQVRAFDEYVNEYGIPLSAAGTMNRSQDESDRRWAQAIRSAKAASAREFEDYR